MIAGRRVRPADTDADADTDAGFSLMELLVAMFVLAIILTMVLDLMTGWVVNGERRASLSNQASDQIEHAFMTLDQEVRYAADINTPGESAVAPNAGDYWVEFESDWTGSSNGSANCTQVEYLTASGILQQRSWLMSTSNSPPSTLGWQPLATGLSTSLSSDPFTLTFTAPNLAYSSGSTSTTSTTTATSSDQATPWQLTVSLSSTLGAGTQTGSAQSSFTISAIDITPNSTDTNVCGGNPS